MFTLKHFKMQNNFYPWLFCNLKPRIIEIFFSIYKNFMKIQLEWSTRKTKIAPESLLGMTSWYSSSLFSTAWITSRSIIKVLLIYQSHSKQKKIQQMVLLQDFPIFFMIYLFHGSRCTIMKGKLARLLTFCLYSS